jgi:hypothetical protein
MVSAAAMPANVAKDASTATILVFMATPPKRGPL